MTRSNATPFVIPGSIETAAKKAPKALTADQARTLLAELDADEEARKNDVPVACDATSTNPLDCRRSVVLIAGLRVDVLPDGLGFMLGQLVHRTPMLALGRRYLSRTAR